MTDCKKGMGTCPKGGDWANRKFVGSTTAGIRNGSIKHHFVIDYWKSQQASSLKVSNIRVKAGGAFRSMCPSAIPE